MSAVTSSPACVVTVNVPGSPGAVGGPARSGLPSSSSAPRSVSWRRSSAFRSGRYRSPSTSPATSTSVTCLPGQTALISPASSMPTGPAPSSSTRPAPARAACVSRTLACAARAGQVGAGQVGLGRERVAGPGGQDQVVREEFGARGEHDPVGVGLDRPVPDHPAAAEQPGVRQVDPLQPRRVDQGAQRRDVVHEVVLGLHQHHVGQVVERPGHLDARVAAAEHHHRRPGRETVSSCR